MEPTQLSAVYKKETSQRENRFESQPQGSRKKNETLRLKREAHKKELDEISRAKKPKNLLQADYKTRGLDFCYYCGEKFNVGEKIPRILIHCGHTFCTECLSVLHHNYRVRCPICRKLVKQVESVDKLPLNFNILYEIVERDYILRDINFEDEDCIECLLCDKHDQRVQHFYCSNHLTVFCRECIKEDHTDERCFVVDLYEIEKMRKMHRLNQQSNKKQLEKRKDDADSSCVSQEIPLDQIQGDSKWFVKRRAKQQEAQKQQLLLLQQNQAAILASQSAQVSAHDQEAMKAMSQMFAGLKNVDFSKLTPEQHEQLIMAATAQGGNPKHAQQLMMAAQKQNQALLLADQDVSDDEDCIDDDDDDNSSDQNFDLEDGEIEVMKEKKASSTRKVFPDVDDEDDCEGIDDSGDYDDDAEEMDDESLEDYDDQDDDDSDKKKTKLQNGDKKTSSDEDGDITPKQVIPQDNAETKLKDQAIEAQLLAEAMGKSTQKEEEVTESEKVEEKEEAK